MEKQNAFKEYRNIKWGSKLTQGCEKTNKIENMAEA